MTYDQNAKDLLNELESLHKEFPTQRLGVLLQSAVDTHKKRKNTDMSDMSTKEILASVREFRESLKTRAHKPSRARQERMQRRTTR